MNDLAYAPQYQGNPAGIILEGGRGLAQGIGQGLQGVGQGLAAYLARKRQETDQAGSFDALRQQLSTQSPTATGFAGLLNSGPSTAIAAANGEPMDETQIDQLTHFAKASDNIRKGISVGTPSINGNSPRVMGFTDKEWSTLGAKEKAQAGQAFLQAQTLSGLQRQAQAQEAETALRQQTLAMQQDSFANANKEPSFLQKLVEMNGDIGPREIAQAASAAGYRPSLENFGRVSDVFRKQSGQDVTGALNQIIIDQLKGQSGQGGSPLGNFGGGGGGGGMRITGVDYTPGQPAKVSIAPIPPRQDVPAGMTPAGATVDKDGQVQTTYKPISEDTKLTQDQHNALMFANRMNSNNRVLAEMEASGFDASGPSGLQSWAPNMFRSEPFQQYTAAKENWISAALRKESGAAISKDEYAAADKQYFPKVGDGPKVVAQKAKLRAQVEGDMLKGVPSAAQKATTAPASSSAKYPTATNPQTGETLIFKDGKWQKQ